MPIADRNLSAHFTLREMLASPTAVRLNITEQFEPSSAIVHNLEGLCRQVLEPLRQIVGTSIHINSGYRCPRLNRRVGGAPKSQHLLGQAADLVVKNKDVETVFQLIRASSLPFDQVIQEFDQWVHVSFRDNPRREALRATKVDGKTVYTPVSSLQPA